MLNGGSRAALLSVALVVAVSPAASASEGEDASIEWLSHLELGARLGAVFAETATGVGLRKGLVAGPELSIALADHRIHRAIVGAGIVKLGDDLEEGSSQVRVHASFRRVDVFAGYGARWKILVAGLRAGVAIEIVEVETSTGTPTYELGEDEIVFTGRDSVETSRRVGSDVGFLVGLSVGLCALDGAIELRAAGDYVRRGERDEGTVWALLAIWPTRLGGD